MKLRSHATRTPAVVEHATSSTLFDRKADLIPFNKDGNESPSETSMEVSEETTLLDKEPTITDETESPYSCYPDTHSSITDSEYREMYCRSVRFGSYKAHPNDKVKITHSDFKLTVTPVNGVKEVPVTVTIPKHDIVKILANFHRRLPVIFLYTTSQAAAEVRNTLNMSSKREEVYFDPTDEVEMYRRITFFPGRIPTETRIFMKTAFSKVLDTLTFEETVKILVKAKPLWLRSI